MREWQVHLEVPGTVPYDSFNVDDILDRLKPWYATISCRGYELGVMMTVKAPSPAEALAKGLRIVKRAAPTAMTTHLLNAEVRPMEFAADPDYLGVSELAEYLGVSCTRLAQLADAPGFPKPLAQVRSGPVWERATFMHYAPRSSARR